jgi:hypothetical protein
MIDGVMTARFLLQIMELVGRMTTIKLLDLQFKTGLKR